jgi:hypothetical protein
VGGWRSARGKGRRAGRYKKVVSGALGGGLSIEFGVNKSPLSLPSPPLADMREGDGTERNTADAHVFLTLIWR